MGLIRKSDLSKYITDVKSFLREGDIIKLKHEEYGYWMYTNDKKLMPHLIPMLNESYNYDDGVFLYYNTGKIKENPHWGLVSHYDSNLKYKYFNNNIWDVVEIWSSNKKKSLKKEDFIEDNILNWLNSEYTKIYSR